MSRFTKVFAVLALLLVLGGGFLMNTTSASAHMQKQTAQQGVSCADYTDWQPGFALLYWTRINGTRCWDGSNVWFTRVDCSYYAVIAAVNFTYCGAVRSNQSTGEVGSNWQVSFIWNGSPISYPGYQRDDYDANGNLTSSYGIG